MDTDDISDFDTGRNSDQGVSLLIRFILDLDAVRTIGDAAFDRVMRLIDLDENDDSNDDSCGYADADSDDLALRWADAS